LRNKILDQTKLLGECSGVIEGVNIIQGENFIEALVVMENKLKKQLAKSTELQSSGKGANEPAK
jgi:hypothetical protein